MRLTWKLCSLLLLVVLFVSVVSAAEPKPAPKPDPSGATTGTVADIPAKVAGKLTSEEIADAVGHNRVGINMTWTLNTGYLVMFMAAGFALVAAGFTRAKNVAHTITMVFMVYASGTIGWWMCGFALMFGGLGAISTLGGAAVLDTEVTFTLFGKSFGLFGGTGFFLFWRAFCFRGLCLFFFPEGFLGY